MQKNATRGRISCYRMLEKLCFKEAKRPYVVFSKVTHEVEYWTTPTMLRSLPGQTQHSEVIPRSHPELLGHSQVTHGAPGPGSLPSHSQVTHGAPGSLPGQIRCSWVTPTSHTVLLGPRSLPSHSQVLGHSQVTHGAPGCPVIPGRTWSDGRYSGRSRSLHGRHTVTVPVQPLTGSPGRSSHPRHREGRSERPTEAPDSRSAREESSRTSHGVAHDDESRPDELALDQRHFFQGGDKNFATNVNIFLWSNTDKMCPIYPLGLLNFQVPKCIFYTRNLKIKYDIFDTMGMSGFSAAASVVTKNYIKITLLHQLKEHVPVTQTT